MTLEEINAELAEIEVRIVELGGAFSRTHAEKWDRLILRRKALRDTQKREICL